MYYKKKCVLTHSQKISLIYKKLCFIQEKGCAGYNFRSIFQKVYDLFDKRE